MKQEEIIKKIEIFKQTNIINDEMGNKTLKVLNLLEAYDMDKVDTFITHMVMSINRFFNEVKVDPIIQTLIDEINSNTKRELCDEVLKKINQILGLELHPDEILYYRLHILNILD